MIGSIPDSYWNLIAFFSLVEGWGACELQAVKRKMLRAIQGKMLCSLVLALRAQNQWL